MESVRVRGMSQTVGSGVTEKIGYYVSLLIDEHRRRLRPVAGVVLRDRMASDTRISDRSSIRS
jgi:hypothetical protein